MRVILLTILLSRLLLSESRAATVQHTQRIRGTVVSVDSRAPLPGATVVVVSVEPVLGTVTGADGTFLLEGVALGRQTVRVSLLGYKEQTIANTMLTSAKETILNVSLDEQVYKLGEARVVHRRDKATPNNDMTSVSARSFNVEETSRFAGSRNDPARMATNFAGVSGANDARNDIIIRGNSPVGLLWRLDGINIPNPNHFGALGATGGPVSLMNYNVLDKSDFLTAAFPAQYGNAVAGVFDLQMRKGNNQQHEYLGQIGFNGVEFGAEGPWTSQRRSSFLVHYRYSNLSAFQALGLEFGTGTGTPKYQDLNYRLHFPTAKGAWSVFGLAGVSRINLLGSQRDTTQANYFGSDSRDTYFKYLTAVSGASYQHQLSEKTFGKVSVAASRTREQFVNDSLSTVTRLPIRQEESDFLVDKYSVHALLNHRFSSRITSVLGAMSDIYDFGLHRTRLTPGGGPNRARQSSGRPTLLQGYSQWQYKLSDDIKINAGLAGAFFTASRRYVIEPRIGAKVFLTPRQQIGLAFGAHSQLQPLQVYYTETHTASGAIRFTNKTLDFTRSKHYVISYDYLFNSDWHLKAEAYYQQLRKAGVEQRPSSFSLLNAGAGFEFPDVDSLVNRGSGRNYGLEITCEKFFNRGYYVLSTVSLFDSKYRGSDRIWRNTTFNGRYVINVLAGAEIKVGRKSNVVNIDWKLTAAGGRYTTPVDEARSRLLGEQVFIESRAFSRQLPNYFRTDLKFSYRRNGNRITQEYSLDLQNVLNTHNVFLERFNPRTGRYTIDYQIGFFPIPQYRLLF
ncbi:TonB-dependent receptor [Hymenobacter gummosus]|uniref:TonB-dependent receptor n=1 Tax=Hymenobacter gummosus TaxID=1776032 RepID=A0A431U9V1_9BACT|nr:TonB-dependent receptor [Hymenobacter gummosus]RTQ53735.1 TonB-dependent receptor [Hymenobacter gummosus]